MIIIDKNRCNSCPGLATPLCTEACPGVLPRRGADGKSEIRDNSACWDCTACVKACPRSAISMALPFQISEEQLRLDARCRAHETMFQITTRDGRTVRKDVVPAKKR